MGNFHSGKKSCMRFLVDKLFQTEFAKLIAAIRAGNIGLVKRFYQQKVNFLQYLHNGDTPFHIAVKFNNLEIVRFIAENVQNLNVNDQNFLGDTPLLLAIMNGNKEILNYLLSKPSIDVDVAENKGYTPFIAACASGEIGFVDKLCKHGCNIKLKTRDGQTALHRAAFYGHQKVIIYLIQNLKMNAMISDRKGNLPLHYACMKLNISCMRILIKVTNYTATELLYIPNKYDVRPIDIILKVLGRIRGHDDPQTTAEQIEEYLSDKYNLPPFKKTISPGTINGSITKSTIFQNQRESAKTIKSQVIRLQSVNENAEMFIESRDVASPTTIIEEKPTENEEEQFIRRRPKSRFESAVSDFSSFSPPQTILFKKIQLPQNDGSPVNNLRSFTMIAPRLLLAKEKSLKINTTTLHHENSKFLNHLKTGTNTNTLQTADTPKNQLLLKSTPSSITKLS